jgi:hypothetical protein
MWPFETKAAVLLCHCETFVVADLRAFRDVRKMVFAISVRISVRLNELQKSDVCRVYRGRGWTLVGLRGP